jgi:DNA-binding NtrC family response regulator
MDRLKSYAWPGNVRELENVIERAVILSAGDDVEVRPEVSAATIPHVAEDALGPNRCGETAAERDGTGGDEAMRLAEVEKQHMLAMLERARWRIEGPQGAASMLGMNPSTLRSRMKKLGISTPRRPADG